MVAEELGTDFQPLESPDVQAYIGFVVSLRESPVGRIGALHHARLGGAYHCDESSSGAVVRGVEAVAQAGIVAADAVAGAQLEKIER